MKKAILLGLCCAILCSCYREDTDKCSAMRNLLFTHYCEYDSDESFDNRIGNDVVLCIYKDGKLKLTEKIPYEKIKGGKIYSYRKRFGGNIHIVAWSVPAGSSSPIPQYAYGEDFDMRLLESETRAIVYKPFADDIYLGTEFLADDDIKTETTHKIRMINCASQVLVNVEDPVGGFTGSDKEFYVLVEGVMSKMNLRYTGAGEPAEVYARLSQETTDFYSTGYFGVLPSSETQSVDVRVFYDGKCIATVKTGAKAVSGGRITVNLNFGIDVYVEVNGWEVVDAKVEWM